MRILSLLYFIFFISISSEMFAQSSFVAGGEFQITAIDPKNNPKLVEIRLVIYRDCAGAVGGGGRRGPGARGGADTADRGILIRSSKCCIDTLQRKLRYKSKYSEKNVTPLCPYNTPNCANPQSATTCDCSNTSNPGYRTMIFADTFLLPDFCDDWVIDHLELIPDAGNLQLAGVSFNQMLTIPLLPNANPIQVRMQGINTQSCSQNQLNCGYYTRAEYSNKVYVGKDQNGKDIYIANTTPRFASNPMLFQCLGVVREYDLGFYDVDGDSIGFEMVSPKVERFSLTDPGQDIQWGNLGSVTFDALHPLGSNSIYSISPQGIITLQANAGIGYYNTALKISEYRAYPGCTSPSGKCKIGETLRDIVVTIINTPECSDQNKLAYTAEFIPGISNLTNCGVSQYDPDEIQVCPGTTASFTMRAEGTTSYKGAALDMDYEFDTTKISPKDVSLIATYIDNPHPIKDTGLGIFTWNIPSGTKPGLYPVIFKIKDCIDGTYILSRTKNIKIRVNDKTSFNWKYTGLTESLKYGNYSNDTAVYCPGGLIPLAIATNNQNSAMFQWNDITNPSNIVDLVLAGNTSSSSSSLVDDQVYLNLPTNSIVEVTSNQYCLNKDTIILKAVSNPSPLLTGFAADTCYMSKVNLLVANAPAGTLFQWVTQNSKFDNTPNALSNTATGVFISPSNTYNVYPIMPNGCVVQLNKKYQTQGIKPTILSYTTDKTFACPFDTINVNSRVTTGICGEDNYNAVFTQDTTIDYPGTLSFASVVPKIFAGNFGNGTAANPIVKFMKTQIIYLGKELRSNNFKSGKIHTLGIDLFGIGTLRRYNNVKIRVRCTPLYDLSGGMIPEDSMMTIYDMTDSFVILSKGWNEFKLDKTFSWDESTNLIFQFEATCVDQSTSTDAPPAYNENGTKYISISGIYSATKDGLITNPLKATSNVRPNIRWVMYPIDTTGYTASWVDSSTNSVGSTLFKRKFGSIVSGYDTPNPLIIANASKSYIVTVFSDTNKRCFSKDTLSSDYYDQYKINIINPLTKVKIDSAHKCPDDTLKLTTTHGIPVNRDYIFNCILSEKLCRKADTQGSIAMGGNAAFISTTNSRVDVSPYGGAANNNLLDQATDRKVQYIFTAKEIRAQLLSMPGVTSYSFNKGFLINSMIFNLNLTFPPPYNALSGFSVGIRCHNDTVFRNNSFFNIYGFETVYENDMYDISNKVKLTTAPNYDTIVFSKPYEWDGKSNIIVSICWDLDGITWKGMGVSSTTFPANNFKTLYKGVNTVTTSTTEFGCAYTTGTLSNIRPNVKFSFCKATPIPPPIPKSYFWAPGSFISNTRDSSPVVFNPTSANYFTFLDYYDTTVSPQRLACRVKDSVFVIVDRPSAIFTPSKPVVCLGDSIDIEVQSLVQPRNAYSYEWETPSQGFNIIDKYYDIVKITPPGPKYYYVKIKSRSNPNCWNRDSVYVDVQTKTTMPDISGILQICPNDSTALSIPSGLGYKNPRWVFNNFTVGTDYVYYAKTPGAYYVIVDSGVCTNKSINKIVNLRPTSSIYLSDTLLKLCQGDTATIYSIAPNGVVTALWNNGISGPVNRIAESGQYYLINPIDNFGCLLNNKDTLDAYFTPNPTFELKDDSVCIDINQSKKLIVDPIDPLASYSWSPGGQIGSSIEVYNPGVYTVTRTRDNCTKSTNVTVLPMVFGAIDLGLPKAICCDEIITLDANPTSKNYIAYQWSTGSKSQVISTYPNTSGLYIVEATRPSGCKDTGSIFIDNKCTQLKAAAQRQEIYLGEINNMQSQHIDSVNSKFTYNWIASQDWNPVVDKDKKNAIAKPTDTGLVEYVLALTVTDPTYMPPKTPCLENAIVRFHVKPNNLEMKNTFSPNDDGINDNFYPIIEGVVKMNEFKVYNRFGQLLHNDANSPWDGKYSGQFQPIGTYIGLISYDKQEPRKPLETKYEQININIVR